MNKSIKTASVADTVRQIVGSRQRVGMAWGSGAMALVASMALTSAPVVAQEAAVADSLDEVVVTGTRIERAGFNLRRLRKVLLSWKQFPCGTDLQHHPPPWDWFFLAKGK